MEMPVTICMSLMQRTHCRSVRKRQHFLNQTHLDQRLFQASTRRIFPVWSTAFPESQNELIHWIRLECHSFVGISGVVLATKRIELRLKSYEVIQYDDGNREPCRGGIAYNYLMFIVSELICFKTSMTYAVPSYIGVRPRIVRPDRTVKSTVWRIHIC
jgi:hypothetical protein